MGEPAKNKGKAAEIIEFPGSESEDGTDRSGADVTDSGSVSAGFLADMSEESRKQAHDLFDYSTDANADMRTGDRLKAAREVLGIDLDALAKETILRKSYLEAIESMYVGNIPKGYLTPILRSYASALKLPAEDIVKHYTAECGAVETVEESAAPIKPARSEGTGGKGKMIAGGAIAAVVMISGTIWGVTSLGNETVVEPSTRIIANLPAVNGANESLFAESVPLAAIELPLELTAISQGWIEVRGADGTIFRSRMMNAGETYHPRLGAGWTVSARNGAAFEWRVGDATLGPLGPEGAPVYALSIDSVANDAAQSLTPAMAASAIEGQPTR